jgi:subtilisin-like proprotein convertase family protein
MDEIEQSELHNISVGDPRHKSAKRVCVCTEKVRKIYAKDLRKVVSVYLYVQSEAPSESGSTSTSEISASSSSPGVGAKSGTSESGSGGTSMRDTGAGFDGTSTSNC